MRVTGTARSGRVRPVVVGVALALAVGAASAVVPTAPAVAAADPRMSVAPMPVTAVPLAQAGEVAVWGHNDAGQATVPASLAGVAVSQVAVAESVVLALTAAGKVVGWGGNLGRLQRIPDEVSKADVAQIATGTSEFAGAVTRDGRVLMWGITTRRPSPLSVPAGLTGVTQLVLANWNAVALKADGSVVAWGADEALNQIPPALAGVRTKAIVAGNDTAYALTEDGTVIPWGNVANVISKMPASVLQPGNVKAIGALGYGGVAVLADDTVVQWDIREVSDTSWLAGSAPVSVSAGGGFAGMVDSDGVIHHWNEIATAESGLVPAALNGRALAQFSVGPDRNGAVVITKMLRGADPTIAGTPTVGSTLTATPGTFSASPDAVTSQWLADGAPVAGASGAALSLTPALLGKKITYQSTATKAGETTISSTSAAVTVTEPAPVATPKVASTTKVLKVKVAKNAKKLAVTGKVTAAKPVTGKAKVTIKKGKKTIVAKTVKVSAKGSVALTVKKFGKLVIKKLTPKKKGKKGKKGKKPSYYGKYVVSIDYAGNAQVDPSKAAKKFTVKKAKPKKGKK
ncbi:hypothetical protein KM427_10840 [Nocardioides sp. LMS-CY]|uniref:hypothetical protein n=1 Tax=Nocardioides sp. (strain LMS-CY) TaxID=2840457 RepID=UPI001C001A7B|nr:hypothetical protein [Nocardioides sp. LMS-CY]QWF24136.1 hypothetical protein KM427_10840 [Nocardioides sp. LMS-CY]